MASKILLALFPPNSPFFRLSVRDDIVKYLESAPEMKQQIEQALVQREQVVVKYIETSQIRVTALEALKQLIVAGNCLLFLPPKEGGIKLYRLNNYVCQRDALGNVIQLIATDKFTVATLPKDLQSVANVAEKKADEEIIIYTHIYYDNSGTEGVFMSYQEVEGQRINGLDQKFPKDKCPWIPLRLVKLDGESYGRGYIEEYLGDLKSFENLTKAIVDLAGIAATVINLVNPNGITQIRKVVNCKNGGFAPGRRADIETLQLEKSQDMQVAKMTADSLEARLSYAFMLNSAVQRQGERVTAEEIRYVAGELEDTLGGIYSILSQELQLPLVKCLLNQLESTGELPPIPNGTVEPAITTGIEAIGRGHDFNQLTEFLQSIAQIPEAAAEINWSNVTLALASSKGLDTTGLIKTPEEKAAEQQQAMMSQMATQATPNVTKGIMDGLNAQPSQQSQV